MFVLAPGRGEKSPTVQEECMQYPEWFKVPHNIKEAEERIVGLDIELGNIAADLTDAKGPKGKGNRRRFRSHSDYLSWRGNAIKKQTTKIQKKKLLKHWIREARASNAAQEVDIINHHDPQQHLVLALHLLKGVKKCKPEDLKDLQRRCGKAVPVMEHYLTHCARRKEAG
jgi:hypothetical protein